ncbi:MAG: pyridoxamine 5'-phosphate oxidase family protein, partial [Acidobacteria bacterium]|nr:pyridoxamine 5'-phosphate oxidase family protein [Acidobacteriota bacterium]
SLPERLPAIYRRLTTKVTVERAEYWDSPSSAVMHAVGFVKAIATGQTYEPGDNVKLDLKKTAGTQS